MKKNITKYVIALVTIISLTSNYKNVYSKNNINNKSNELFITKEILYNETSNKIINNYLYEELGTDYKLILEENRKAVNSAKSIEESFNKDKNGEIIYPEYFGGIYINNDNSLVVQIIKNNISSSNINQYTNLINEFEISNIEFVNYSYKELYKLYTKIVNKYTNEKTIDYISGVYIDTISNDIVVELTTKNEEIINNFKNKVSSSAIIRFEQGHNFETITDLNPGASYGKCSFAYRAKLSGKDGIVTAAHCVNLGQTFSFGTVKKWQRSGSIDAAWIETNLSYNPTNILAQNPPFSNINTITTNVVTSFYSGQSIAKLGGATGFTIGTVTHSNYSGIVDGVNHTNLVRANLIANHGDSGGIVVDTNITLNSTGYTTAGVVTAKSTSNNEDMLFTKANQINSIFGISRY